SKYSTVSLTWFPLSVAANEALTHNGHFFTVLIGQFTFPHNEDHVTTPPCLFVDLRNAVYPGDRIPRANRGQKRTLLPAIKATLAIIQLEIRQPSIAPEDNAKRRGSNEAAVWRSLGICLVHVQRVGFANGLGEFDNVFFGDFVAITIE